MKYEHVDWQDASRHDTATHLDRILERHPSTGPVVGAMLKSYGVALE